MGEKWLEEGGIRNNMARVCVGCMYVCEQGCNDRKYMDSVS